MIVWMACSLHITNCYKQIIQISYKKITINYILLDMFKTVTCFSCLDMTTLQTIFSWSIILFIWSYDFITYMRNGPRSWAHQWHLWKISFGLILIFFNESGHHYTHLIGAVLQNCDLIGSWHLYATAKHIFIIFQFLTHNPFVKWFSRRSTWSMR